MADTDKKPWVNGNGTSKPEWNLNLRSPLSDGTKLLALREPNVKALRKATKMLVFGDKGDPTAESGIDFGVALIAAMTDLPNDIVEELPQSTFSQAVEYLQSFN